MLVEEDNDKKTVIALREIGDEKVDISELRANAILRLRKEPDDKVEEEETEEVSNDDFEKMYKGEVSKSGVAILPSRECKKITVQTSTSDIKKTKTLKNKGQQKKLKNPKKLTEEAEAKQKS